MKKKLFIFMILAAVFVGCQNEGANTTKSSKSVSLTQQEVDGTKGNASIAAQLLVRKAILNEIKGQKYSEAENKELNTIKENAEIDYFLNKKAMAVAKVSDEEALELYNNNKDSFKNVTQEQAVAYIKEQLLINKIEAEKTNYINQIITDYDLNSKISEYYPDLDKKDNQPATDKATNNEAKPQEEKSK